MLRKCEHGADQACRCGQCYCSECFPGPVCPDCLKCDECQRTARLEVTLEDHQHLLCIHHGLLLAYDLVATGDVVSTWFGGVMEQALGRLKPGECKSLHFGV